MAVAERFLRKRKITITTRHRLSSRVNFTSLTESRTDCERSIRTSSFTAAGICARKLGRSFLIASTTSTVLVPGCRCTVSTIARVPLYQLATLSFSTLSVTWATSSRRTGEPSR